MKKNTIKLNESQLRNIIKESVKKVLNEDYEDDAKQNDFRKIEKIKNEVRAILPADAYNYYGREELEDAVNDVCEKLDELLNLIQILSM